MRFRNVFFLISKIHSKSKVKSQKIINVSILFSDFDIWEADLHLHLRLPQFSNDNIMQTSSPVNIASKIVE